MKAIFANNILEVLSVFFLLRGEEIHQAKIAESSGLRKLQVQRALQRLRDSELIEEHKQGSMVYYKLNEDHPALSDLKSIIYKMVLIADPLKQALSKIADAVDLVFVYGSFASGTESVESDIDLFIVGNVKLKKLSSVLAPVAEQLQREVNPVVYSNSEFIDKAKSKDHFISSVLNSEKMWLVGGDDELEEILKWKETDNTPNISTRDSKLT